MENELCLIVTVAVLGARGDRDRLPLGGRPRVEFHARGRGDAAGQHSVEFGMHTTDRHIQMIRGDLVDRVDVQSEGLDGKSYRRLLVCDLFDRLKGRRSAPQGKERSKCN